MVMVNLGKFSHGEWGTHTHTISKFCLGKCWVEPKKMLKSFEVIYWLVTSWPSEVFGDWSCPTVKS